MMGRGAFYDLEAAFDCQPNEDGMNSWRSNGASPFESQKNFHLTAFTLPETMPAGESKVNARGEFYLQVRCVLLRFG